MDIFSVLGLLGGLGFFLFGMKLMGTGLEKAAGSKLERIVEKMTDSTLKGLLLGAGVTAIIQSSSATTVMAVGFVNSGIMKLRQAVSIIMGANIGTTITAWVLSLTGIEGDSVLLKFLKPSGFSPVFAVIGAIIIVFSKKSKNKNYGSILMGFAVLMTGMDTMSNAVSPLAQIPEFTNILTMFNNPLFGILAGAVLTAIIQSSSASVGILQALASTGAISYGIAIPIVMGQNIGTCVTAALSTIGANKNAKRAGFTHLYFNIIGTGAVYLIFFMLNSVFSYSFTDVAVNAADIALIHTIFNISATALLLPFIGQIEKLARFTIREGKPGELQPYIDERLLETPFAAKEQCLKIAGKMADLSKIAFEQAMGLIFEYDEKTAQKVLETEKLSDMYEDSLGTFLVKLSSRGLNGNDSRDISKMMLSISDFERIADHAVNLVYAVENMKEKKLSFSKEALEELKVICTATEEIMELTVNSFKNNNTELAVKVEPLEQVIDRLYGKIRKKHINRLRAGETTAEHGFIHNNLLTSIQRVSDHCSNIAVCIIQIDRKAFETHEYLQDIRESDGQFSVEYDRFRDKYNVLE